MFIQQTKNKSISGVQWSLPSRFTTHPIEKIGYCHVNLFISEGLATNTNFTGNNLNVDVKLLIPENEADFESDNFIWLMKHIRNNNCFLYRYSQEWRTVELRPRIGDVPNYALAYLGKTPADLNAMTSYNPSELRHFAPMKYYLIDWE